jgi:hypothetical protein
MPKHSYRWCTFEIEYERPDERVWNKKFTRSVRSDEEINDFKRACQVFFLAAHGNAVQIDDDNVHTVFHDGYVNQPQDAKLI